MKTCSTKKKKSFSVTQDETDMNCIAARIFIGREYERLRHSHSLSRKVRMVYKPPSKQQEFQEPKKQLHLVRLSDQSALQVKCLRQVATK